jgi:hypothetical protein
LSVVFFAGLLISKNNKGRGDPGWRENSQLHAPWGSSSSLCACMHACVSVGGAKPEAYFEGRWLAFSKCSIHADDGIGRNSELQGQRGIGLREKRPGIEIQRESFVVMWSEASHKTSGLLP